MTKFISHHAQIELQLREAHMLLNLLGVEDNNSLANRIMTLTSKTPQEILDLAVEIPLPTRIYWDKQVRDKVASI